MGEGGFKLILPTKNDDKTFSFNMFIDEMEPVSKQTGLTTRTLVPTLNNVRTNFCST